MAKRRRSLRRPVGIVSRVMALMLRNKATTIGLALSIFIGIPGIAVSTVYIRDSTEPWWYARHAWVRELQKNGLQPIMMKQEQHDYTLQYLIQEQARGALKNARERMQRTPNSDTQHEIEKLEKAIERRQKFLDKIE